MNHDLSSEPIGRVIAARMDKEEDGSHFVRLQIAITDPVAAQKVSDQRYLTGSVGGKAGKAVCSISGDDLASEDANGRPKAARYKRGSVYKGKVAFIDMQDISFKEYSFVNQPADQRSGVRSKKKVDGKLEITDSDGWVAKSKAFVLHMNEEDIVSVEENESILNSLKKKESRPMYLHLKGAFLSAVAIQESENSKNTNNSLLSNENEVEDNHEENPNMSKDVEQEDILAAIDNLSEDLNAIASNATESNEESEGSDNVETPNAEESQEVEEESSEKNNVDDSKESNNSDSITEAVEGPASAVQKVLNEMIVLGFVAQRAHWNVTGTDFEEYHALFGAIYEDIFDSVDAVAEEIRKMGVMVENLTSMIMGASFKDDASASDARTLTEDVLAKNIILNETVLAAFTSCSEANQQGTADVLASRDGMHKKWSWQLRSSLGEEAGEPAEESWRDFGSKNISANSEEPAKEAVDSDSTEVVEENEGPETSESELTNTSQVSEQNVSDEKLQALQQENAKLKEALHRTLAERVVDTKIALGVESVESREDLLKEHSARSASSLADSLRDLVRLPSTKKSIYALGDSLMEDSIVSENEDNVIDEDVAQEENKTEKKTLSAEELFVDALMGRRKL
jgi:starvation-inducible DNA-binding protein